MTASLYRATLFARVRSAPFCGSLSQGQVSGMEALLDACPPALGVASSPMDCLQSTMP